MSSLEYLPQPVQEEIHKRSQRFKNKEQQTKIRYNAKIRLFLLTQPSHWQWGKIYY